LIYTNWLIAAGNRRLQEFPKPSRAENRSGNKILFPAKLVVDRNLDRTFFSPIIKEFFKT